MNKPKYKELYLEESKKYNDLKKIIIDIFRTMEKNYDMEFVYVGNPYSFGHIFFINQLEDEAVRNCPIEDYYSVLEELMIEKIRGEDSE